MPSLLLLILLVLLEQVLQECHCQTSHDDGNHRHELDKNVQTWARRVLEWVAYCVTDDSCLVAVRAFATEVALFDHLLGIVLCTTSVGHKDCERETSSQSADKQT